MSTGIGLGTFTTREYIIEKLNLGKEIENIAGEPYSPAIFSIKCEKTDIDDTSDSPYQLGYRSKKYVEWNSKKKEKIEEYAKFFAQNNDGLISLRGTEGEKFHNIQGCLSLFRKNILGDCGILSEVYGLRGVDDLEFEKKIVKNGYSTIIDTSLYFHHNVTVSSDFFIE